MNKILVCGCGRSLNNLRAHHLTIPTIGVNDCANVIVPDYLIVVDNDFTPERRKIVDMCRQDSILVSHIPECFDFANKIKIDLGEYAKLDNLNEANNKVDWSTTSTYMAVIYAYKFLKCNDIALIGVDFTPNHYNRNDGKYKLDLSTANAHYKMLASELNKNGCRLVNVSEESLIDIEKMKLEQWLKEV